MWMHELDDIALLREFAGRGSEAAFAELVTRHVNKVYSVALRHTRNPHQAEEITQAVFVILARKAGQLGKKVILSGWLYQTARLTAVTLIRSEIRRARREQEVLMQNLSDETEADPWPHIAPLLDDAMAGLSETDRHAVVLRYFDGKSMKEVGAALGGSEDAAKMRVNRAVEKLRTFFAKRGVVTSTAVLTAMISANSVQAAPAVLAKSVTAVAITKGVATSGSTLTLIKGALKLMAWTKAKTAIVVGLAAILTVGTTSIAFHHNPAAIIDFFLFSRTKELSSDEDAQYAKWTGTTPEQVAKTFFEACGREDWTEVAKFWNEPGTRYPLDDKIKKDYGGLQVVSLGKPFWAWTRFGGKKFGGAFVPYEIRFKNGGVKKFQLQVRCDNPDKRWYVDGGL